MSSDYFDTSDDFSRNPFVTLLPKLGSASRLKSLSASLHARFELVEKALSEVSSEDSTEERRKLMAERKMLDQVFGWMNVNPQKQTEKDEDDLGIDEISGGKRIHGPESTESEL